MKTAYIFHDAFNNQFSDWYQWMKTELEKLGYVTLVPQFPTPAAQSYESWKAVIKNYIGTFDEETLLIGHGTGGVFALRLVEDLPKKIRGVFLVASYAEPIGHGGYDAVNTTFFQHEFNWSKIINQTFSRGIITGNDDPFVPLEITERLGKNLSEAPTIIPDAGHINKASGFTQAVPVLQKIIEILGSIDKTITLEQPDEVSITTTKEITSVSDDPSAQIDTPEPEKTTTKNPAIHTMYEDMSTLIHSNKGSVASSLLTQAREEEKIKKESSPMSWKNILYILGTVLVIVTAIGVLGYVFYQYLPAQQQPVVPRPASLLPSESYTVIDITDKLLFEVQETIKDLSKEKINAGAFHDFIFIESGKRIPFARLIERLEISTFPNILKDQFGIDSANGEPLFMYGGVDYDSEKPLGIFIIIPFISYDAMFIGMNEWEKTMVRDLGPLLQVPQSTLDKFFNETTFQDETIYNKPTQVFRDETNNFIAGYFFLNQKTIVFINDPELIPLIIKRYANREVYQ